MKKATKKVVIGCVPKETDRKCGIVGVLRSNLYSAIARLTDIEILALFPSKDMGDGVFVGRKKLEIIECIGDFYPFSVREEDVPCYSVTIHSITWVNDQENVAIKGLILGYKGK